MKLNTESSSLTNSIGVLNERNNEIMEAMLVANKRFKGGLVHSSDAFKQIEEVMRRNRENIRKMTKAMEGINRITVPTIKVNWQIPIVDIKPITEHSSLMKSMEVFQKSLSKHSEWMKAFEGIGERQQETMLKLAQSFSENRMIKLGEIIDSIEESECNELIGDRESFEEEINSVIGNEKLNWQQKIMTLIEIFKQKNPIISFLIAFILFAPVLASMQDTLQTAYENAIESKALNGINKENQKEFKKQVINNIIIMNSEYKESILNSYKFVSKDNLEVRQNNAMKSEVIYRLSYGEIVKVAWKNKQWTLIQYQNENKIIEGWVLTKYIERLD